MNLHIRLFSLPRRIRFASAKRKRQNLKDYCRLHWKLFFPLKFYLYQLIPHFLLTSIHTQTFYNFILVSPKLIQSSQSNREFSNSENINWYFSESIPLGDSQPSVLICRLLIGLVPLGASFPSSLFPNSFQLMRHGKAPGESIFNQENSILRIYSLLSAFTLIAWTSAWWWETGGWDDAAMPVGFICRCGLLRKLSSEHFPPRVRLEESYGLMKNCLAGGHWKALCSWRRLFVEACSNEVELFTFLRFLPKATWKCE